MWYVYILQSQQDRYLYVGMTNDLRNRLEFHNQRRVSSTQKRAPFIVIYYETHINKHDAAAREQFLKSGWGKHWIKRTLKNYFCQKS